MLVTSIFSLPHNVFLSFPKTNYDFSVSVTILSSTNASNSDYSKMLSFGKVLTHSHTMTPFDVPGKQAF